MPVAMNTIRTFLSLSASLAWLAAWAHAAPVSLFDGKSLDGWDFDPKVWRVEDGMITGGSRTEKIRENFFICTKKSYQNFELVMKIKCSGDPATGMINSGIQIRSVRVPGGNHMSGYQVDCGAGWFGKIYDEFRRNRVIAEPVDAAALAKVVDVFGWNTYRIRAEGPASARGSMTCWRLITPSRTRTSRSMASLGRKSTAAASASCKSRT